MEVVTCLLCGETRSSTRVRGTDRMCNVPGEFTLVECAGCGFLYLSPRPDANEIHRYYPDSYPCHTMSVGEDAPPFARSLAEYEMNKRCEAVIGAATDGCELLDVGCGVGDFLGAMQARGWHARGVEPDPHAVEQARLRHGVDVIEGYLDATPYGPASFDAITLWEVLEHVPQPVDTLRSAFELLKPGGVVVLSLPNRTALQAKLFRSYWIGYDFPRHFSVFAPADMRRAFDLAGFVESRVFSERGRLGAMHNEIVWVVSSLGMWLGTDVAERRARGLARRVVAAAATNPVAIVTFFMATLPLSIMVRKLNRGSQMFAVARKPLSA